jgi:hypothetical protein
MLAANRDCCWLPLIIIGVALFVLWRTPLALVMFGGVIGPDLASVLLVILGVVRTAERMARPPV